MDIIKISAQLLIVLLLSSVVSAQQSYQPPFTAISDDIRYDVNRDGTFIREEKIAIRINNDSGLQLAQFPLPFNQALQQLTVLEAYSMSEDGEKETVEGSDIHLQTLPAVQGAPVFGDLKMKVVVFPAVEVGTTLFLHYQLEQRTPQFENHFFTLETFSTIYEFQQASLTISAPETMPLHIDAKAIKGGEITATDKEKKTWRWTVENSTAFMPELNSISPEDSSPRVAVSSFSSIQALSEAYLQQAEPKAAITPKIQRQADKITKGINGKLEQAEAIYNWVSSKIRYVNVVTGLGGFVPHPADAILKSRYGDCKDHVTLLQALLAAKGIESHPVLVEATLQYWQPSVATPAAFNHVITYIPAFDLYLDATAAVAPFGVLPPMESGKKALLAHSKPSQVKWVTLPYSQLDHRNAEYVTSTMDVSNSGDIHLVREVNATGVNELVMRSFLSMVPRGQEKQMVTFMLNQLGQTGRGTARINEPRDLKRSAAYTLDIKLKDLMADDKGVITFPLGIPSRQGIEQFVAAAGQERSNFDFPCQSSYMEHHLTIKIPEGLVLENIPASGRAKSKYGNYESSYHYANNILEITRSLDMNLPGICNSDDHKYIRALAEGIASDIRSPVHYRWINKN